MEEQPNPSSKARPFLGMKEWIHTILNVKLKISIRMDFFFLTEAVEDVME